MTLRERCQRKRHRSEQEIIDALGYVAIAVMWYLALAVMAV